MIQTHWNGISNIPFGLANLFKLLAISFYVMKHHRRVLDSRIEGTRFSWLKVSVELLLHDMILCCKMYTMYNPFSSAFFILTIEYLILLPHLMKIISTKNSFEKKKTKRERTILPHFTKYLLGDNCVMLCAQDEILGNDLIHFIYQFTDYSTSA